MNFDKLQMIDAFKQTNTMWEFLNNISNAFTICIFHFQFEYSPKSELEV